MFDEGIVEELVEDINSWSSFYIVCDEKSIDLVRDFQNRLEGLKISSVLVDDGAEYDFEQDDCLLAVSHSGEDKHVLEVVNATRLADVKVYGLCIDLKSSLAQLCDECIFADEDNFKVEFQEFLNAIAEKVENQLKEEEFEITPAYYLGPGQTTFIVSDDQSLVFAEELERNLTSKEFKVTIISKGMEDEFKSRLQKGNSVIAITIWDDFFVLAMAEFAKSKGIFVMGMGQDFKSILAEISDEFRVLSQVDELAGILHEMEDGFKQTKVKKADAPYLPSGLNGAQFKQTKVEKALIKGPSTKRLGTIFKITLLICIVLLIILFFFGGIFH